MACRPSTTKSRDLHQPIFVSMAQQTLLTDKPLDRWLQLDKPKGNKAVHAGVGIVADITR